MLTMLMSLLVMGAYTAPNLYSKKNLVVDCFGRGPSLTIARSEALEECRKSAVHQLQSDFQSKSLTVQTESDAALHEEIESAYQVEGLQCLAPKETREDDGTSVKLTLECNYDLAKVKITKSEQKNVKGLDQAVEARSNHGERGKSYGSQKKSISVTTVPQCSSILVTGGAGKIIRCQRNPVQIVVGPNDKTLIIRADNYKPKEISISDIGGSSVQVILNP